MIVVLPEEHITMRDIALFAKQHDCSLHTTKDGIKMVPRGKSTTGGKVLPLRTITNNKPDPKPAA